MLKRLNWEGWIGKENVASQNLIKICRMDIDVIKQYKASEVEIIINTLVETLLNKAKAITEKSMLGRIRDDKYVPTQ